MQKRVITILIIIVSLSIIGLTIFFTKNIKISRKIMNYYNNQEGTTFELKISDYTNFEWDNVIIYKNPISKKEVSEVLGIDYRKELDLQSGMIFIKDNNIVYEEYFETDFESPYKFVIYSYEDINSESKINKFSKESAIFRVEKNKYNNENRYVLKPMQ